MVEILGFIALFVIPAVAVGVASRYAMAVAQPRIARLRGILATWGLCVVFGIGVGLVVDVLSAVIEKRGSTIPATIAYPMVQFLVGAVAGVIVGIVCSRKVQARQGHGGA